MPDRCTTAKRLTRTALALLALILLVGARAGGRGSSASR
jgi:hypothetical protein